MTDEEQTARALIMATGRAIAENRVTLAELAEQVATFAPDNPQRGPVDAGLKGGLLLQAHMDSSWRMLIAMGTVSSDLWGDPPTLSAAEEQSLRARLAAGRAQVAGS